MLWKINNIIMIIIKHTKVDSPVNKETKPIVLLTRDMEYAGCNFAEV